MCICECLHLHYFFKKIRNLRKKLEKKKEKKLGSARWGKGEKDRGHLNARKDWWGKGAKVYAFTLFHTQCKKLAKVFFLKEPHQSNDYKICYFSRKDRVQGNYA